MIIEEVLAQILGLTFLILSFVFLYNKKALKALVRLFRSKEFLIITGSAFVFLGVTIISLYNSWELSPYLMVTISGWLLLIEGLYRLLFVDLTTKIIKEMDSLVPIKVSLVFTLIIGLWLTIVSFIL